MQTLNNEQIHILFIDDEENLLKGLQRMLRSKKNDWQVSFVSGGENACEYLLHNHVDLIVTDMKMPNFDGSQILSFALLNNPNCVRIILSGQADEEEINRVVHMAHQFIAKPCDSSQLIERIEQACNTITLLRQINGSVEQEALNQIAKSSFPCRKSVILKLIEMLENKCKIDDQLINLVLSDIGITARITQISCSGFYVNHKRYLNIKNAIEALGTERLLKLLKQPRIFGDVSEVDLELFDAFYEKFEKNKLNGICATKEV